MAIKYTNPHSILTILAMLTIKHLVSVFHNPHPTPPPRAPSAWATYRHNWTESSAPDKKGHSHSSHGLAVVCPWLSPPSPTWGLFLSVNIPVGSNSSHIILTLILRVSAFTFKFLQLVTFSIPLLTLPFSPLLILN